MKMFKIFDKNSKKRKVNFDFYQKSLEENGRDQFKKMAELGLNLPVIAL